MVESPSQAYGGLWPKYSKEQKTFLLGLIAVNSLLLFADVVTIFGALLTGGWLSWSLKSGLAHLIVTFIVIAILVFSIALWRGKKWGGYGLRVAALVALATMVLDDSALVVFLIIAIQVGLCLAVLGNVWDEMEKADATVRVRIGASLFAAVAFSVLVAVSNPFIGLSDPVAYDAPPSRKNWGQSIEIRFTTQVPAICRLEYGTDTNYGKMRQEETAGKTHIFTLDDIARVSEKSILVPSQHYRIAVCKEDGRCLWHSRDFVSGGKEVERLRQ